MNKELNIFTLRMLRDQYEAEHMDTEVEALDAAIKALEQPEIIRCKECKWWSNDEYRECSNPNYSDGYVTPKGFYCAWAERRTDERA